MSNMNVDSILSGVIVLLLIIVVWKWYSDSCEENAMVMSCGCKKGRCRCRGMIRTSFPRGGGCQGGAGCDCGSPPGRCDCRSNCICQRQARVSGREGMAIGDIGDAINRVIGGGPSSSTAAQMTQDYSAMTQKMALEQGSEGPKASHEKWVDSLMVNGMATGASSNTILEETGRSYGSSDYVGLTARKFCKARQLAAPADDARQTTSYDSEEYCDIKMDELI